MIIHRKQILQWLIYILLLENLFFALLPAWKGSFIWNYIQDENSYFLLTGYPIIFLNVLISIFIILNSTKISNKYTITICGICMFFITFSMLQNSINIDILEGLFGLLIYTILIGILPRFDFSDKIRNSILILLLIWGIAPIIYFFVSSDQTKLLFLTESGTFSGFALHRNFYSAYAGIGLLSLLFTNWSKYWKLALGSLLTIGIIISESRTAFLGLIIAIFYYKYSNNKHLFVYLSFFIIVGYLSFQTIMETLSSYMVRKDFSNNATREELYQGFLEIIKNHAILGKGENVLYYSINYPDGSPAHNFILQTWADYGIFALIFFTYFLFRVFKSLSRNGKTLFLFMVVIALFQPYIDAGIPSKLMIIVLLLSQIYSNTHKMPCKIQETY